MGSRVMRDVTRKLEDIKILRDLDRFRKQFLYIPETAYLKDFAALKTFDIILNPKYIIRDMLIIYLRCVCDIYEQPDLLQVHIFTFYDDNEVYTFEYSNNMMFRDDITILCFLYVTLHYPCKYETMQVLMSLMKNKYGIQTEEQANRINVQFTKENSQANKLTLCNVAHSYPSVFFDISLKMGYDKFYRKIEIYGFYLPEAFFLPSILLVLPTLNQPPPFAILLLNRLILEIGITENLYTHFAYIYMYSMCSIYPQRLKLELCRKWRIVMKRKNMYKYVPCFAAYRQKAKDMIAEMKSNDPDLASILSRL